MRSPPTTEPTEPTQSHLFPGARYPKPVSLIAVAAGLPAGGAATAEIPATEWKFLEGLKGGSLVDVKWTTAWAPPSTDHPNGHQTAVTTYRCRNVPITRHTKASLFIGPMRFSRTTSHPVGSTENKTLRICSSGYRFFGDDKIVEVGRESLPYGMKEKK